jgi:hypothetical protein
VEIIVYSFSGGRRWGVGRKDQADEENVALLLAGDFVDVFDVLWHGICEFRSPSCGYYLIVAEFDN